MNLPTYVGRIHIHQVPEDRGMWRQRSGVLQYICERSITVPYERKPVCKRRKLLANVLQPKLFTGRSAQHPSYGFRVRQHVQDVLDESRQVLRGRYDDIIFRSVNGNGPAVLLPRPALKLGRGAKSEEYAMSQTFNAAIAVIGIDVGDASKPDAVAPICDVCCRLVSRH